MTYPQLIIVINSCYTQALCFYKLLILLSKLGLITGWLRHNNNNNKIIKDLLKEMF